MKSTLPSIKTGDGARYLLVHRMGSLMKGARFLESPGGKLEAGEDHKREQHSRCDHKKGEYGLKDCLPMVPI